MWQFKERDNWHPGFTDFEKEIIKQRIKAKMAGEKTIAYSISYGGGNPV